MSMPCHLCKSETTVVDTRFISAADDAGGFIRRRRQCLHGHRYTTVEEVVLHVSKSDNYRPSVQAAAEIAKMRAAVRVLLGRKPEPQPKRKRKAKTRRQANPVANPKMLTCAVCNVEFPRNTSGRLRKFCSDRCNKIHFHRLEKKQQREQRTQSAIAVVQERLI